MNNMRKFEQSEPTEDILIDYKLKKANPIQGKKNTDDFIDDSNSDGSSESMSIKCFDEPSTYYQELFQIEGYISECGHNSGRGAPDRQYIYINRRPCDHSKITKLINEIFHQYNRTQYPMFVINITMLSKDVDVNVTPDKLQVCPSSDFLKISYSGSIKYYTLRLLICIRILWVNSVNNTANLLLY